MVAVVAVTGLVLLAPWPVDVVDTGSDVSRRPAGETRKAGASFPESKEETCEVFFVTEKMYSVRPEPAEGRARVAGARLERDDDVMSNEDDANDDDEDDEDDEDDDEEVMGMKYRVLSGAAGARELAGG